MSAKVQPRLVPSNPVAEEEPVAEVVATVAVLACTGGAIAAGVAFGTLYINRKLRLEPPKLPPDGPVVRPSHPSGLDWRRP
jgi:hypothetical protein